MNYLSAPGRRYGVFANSGGSYNVHRLNAGTRDFKGRYVGSRDDLRSAELLADERDRAEH